MTTALSLNPRTGLNVVVSAHRDPNRRLFISARYEHGATLLGLDPARRRDYVYEVSFDGVDVVVCATVIRVEDEDTQLFLKAFGEQALMIEAGLKRLDGNFYPQNERNLENSSQAYFCVHKLPLDEGRSRLNAVLGIRTPA